MIHSPILFLIHNSPETTLRVFESIKSIKPSRLYIAADGPRKDVAGEEQLCQEARKIVHLINWKCEVKTLFRENNLGSKTAINTAIDWFFENEEQGIILEDNYLPSHCFYNFCENLLTYYKNDNRIMHICGSNFQEGEIRGDGSYYFSKYNHVGAWETWKRAWETCEKNITSLNDTKGLYMLENLVSNKEFDFWLQQFKGLRSRNNHYWNYQTLLNQWLNNGLSIIPNMNLVENIGQNKKFNILSNNTNQTQKAFFNMLEIKHPKFMYCNNIADNFTFKKLYYKNRKQSKISKTIQKLKEISDQKKDLFSRFYFSLMNSFSFNFKNHTQV